jgi:dTDP-4-dehydrorhamnose reductase
MRILVVGAAGMLGHALVRELSKSHEVHAAVRRDALPIEGAHRVYGATDVTDVAAIDALLAMIGPASLINAAGVVKQRTASVATQIAVNALAPHRLADLCQARRIAFLHFSTDCVFSGARGGYVETDEPDPADVYGRSKLLGEVVGEDVLTLRTSMIGLELGTHQGLVEWFLRQRGRVTGFRRAIFSGLTTLELARVVRQLYDRRIWPTGLLHVAASPISKHDLLCHLAERLSWLPVRVEPCDEPRIDRSLSAAAFNAYTGYIAPSWEAMLGELAGLIEARRSSAQ